eukprot:PhM_4_TR3346/c0_g2_i1/m.94503/K02152/ATPeV1G, ATP6G; V-type H+-transporting ATPase subunit G
MSRQTENVQKLVEAERKRNEIVSEAKKGRQAKLRQAKADAEKDIAAFKSEREAEFQQYKTSQTGGHDGEKAKLARETDVELKQLIQQGEQQKDKVADAILELLTNVQL